MVRTGLLVVTNLSKISRSLTVVKKYVSKTLYIQLYTGEMKWSSALRPVTSFSKHAAQIYSTSLRTCDQLDVIVIVGNLRDSTQWQRAASVTKPVDVLLFDQGFSGDETSQFMSRYNTRNVIEFSKSDFDGNGNENESDQGGEQGFQTDEPITPTTLEVDSVVLGGTFDRLHSGHKILLTEAVLRARKRVVIGVTDESMIRSKLLYELIEPIETRINSVREFLMAIDHTLTYEIVPISDPFGPTQTDPDIDVIIVSAETRRGGEKVNEVRAAAGLKSLQIHCINLIELETNEEGKETKVSSSNQRMDLLGTRLRQPQPSPNLPNYPYIIGLVGGIASGKSVMSKYFEQLGAIVVNCDRLAHQLYEPGTECYQKLIDHFGRHILSDDDTINRKALGAIVFADKTKLNELNGIVWPELWLDVKALTEDARNAKPNAIVMIEAAVLLQANWQHEVHEIWSLIVPPERAIRRLVNRDNLTEEQAKQRVDAQPKNETMIKESNVVFSTQWSYEFSQQQAQKAWTGLMGYLRKRDEEQR